ncbi:MAG: LON peptidase substrate-binding domain-containing protein [Acidimicrobiales bacterium]
MPVAPMFPLGTVLVPGMVLPLHVFEPRYRRMVDDSRKQHDGTFGVVLIERGSEVGGGDVRTDVGTLARIARADELPDGRWILGVLGVHRIRVERWLPDDPYPRAEIHEWAEQLQEPSEAAEGTADDRPEVTILLRRAAALRREMGEPAPPLDLELADDPVVAGYQAAVVAPLGPADRQALLAASTVPARWRLLRELLVDQVDLLQARLAAG